MKKKKYMSRINLGLTISLIFSQFNSVLSVAAMQNAEQLNEEIVVNEAVSEDLSRQEVVETTESELVDQEIEIEAKPQDFESSNEDIEKDSQDEDEIASYALDSRNSGVGLVQLWQVVPGGQEWKENVDYNTYKNALTCKPNHDLYKRSDTKSTHDTYVNSCYVDDVLYLGEDENNYKVYVSGYDGWVPKSSTKYISLDLNNDGVKVSYEVKVEAYFISEGVTPRTSESAVQDIDVLDFANEYLKEDVYLEDESSIVAYSTPTVQSPSYYSNEGGVLYHYLSKDVTRANYYSKTVVGKAPDWMQSNKRYYSYDGIYFYESWQSIKIDGWGAVNQSNPFYNYYQYLPFRSTTNYSANDMNKYTSQNGYTTVATTYPATNNASALVNTGSIFKSVETKYGINGALQYAMGIHESGWGRSSISITKNNLFGMNATDNNPYGNATGFPSVENGIYYHAERYLSWGYTNPINDKRYYGSHVGNKGSGMNVSYASDPFWGEKIAGWYYRLDKANGLKDYNYYAIGIKTSLDNYNVRNQPSTNSKVLYLTKNGKTGSRIYNYPVLITGEKNGFYQIKTDTPINTLGNVESNDSYVWNRTYGFIDKGAITAVNHTNYRDVTVDSGTDTPQGPTDSYIGNVNSELQRIQLNSSEIGSYLNGEIIIVEWINNYSTVPSQTPAMRLKSTDGEVSYNMFVTPTGTNTYYFDTYIHEINQNKDYYIEVELVDSNNVSPNKKMYVRTDNTSQIGSSNRLGNVGNKTVKYTTDGKNLRLSFEEVNNNYIGNVNSELKRIELLPNNIGTYLTGEFVIVEWVNGQSTVPTTTPRVVLKSTDGAINHEMFITPTGTNTYYFDSYIHEMDASKEYYVEVSLTHPDNVSPNKSMYLRTDTSPAIADSGVLGYMNGKTVSFYSVSGEMLVSIK